MAGKAKNMHQALVVQKVDSAIGFPKTYPMDSDFWTTRARGVLSRGEGDSGPTLTGKFRN